ncbi:BON domain-containing protein [Calycomorphotria hydatis]|uniref:BON domain-containing protein n=1 Tax=Calycomorphotria hydatis TaxID=2528027 RepID=A0A517T9B5_9PLAN|nr:BON domain-containing protein [Calycomorphotria hydatis]QDT64957.1 hypothetical protein V22_22030 [Calycomorphotria hydatis]
MNKHTDSTSNAAFCSRTLADLTATNRQENYMERMYGEHGLELEVQSLLESHPAYSFSNLVVHRIDDGVCITGVADMGDTAPGVNDIAGEVDGVEKVLNRLVVCNKK